MAGMMRQKTAMGVNCMIHVVMSVITSVSWTKKSRSTTGGPVGSRTIATAKRMLTKMMASRSPSAQAWMMLVGMVRRTMSSSEVAPPSAFFMTSPIRSAFLPSSAASMAALSVAFGFPSSPRPGWMAFTIIRPTQTATRLPPI